MGTSKLHIETVDAGTRLRIRTAGDCDADIQTRFAIPRPSNRPPPSSSSPSVRIPRPPPLPSRAR